MSDSELAVEVSVEGEQRALPPTVDVSAYRIVQEALTNTLKHSRGVARRRAPALLARRARGRDRRRRPPERRAPASAPGGLGLIGMRERAALHGGQLSAGPAAGGGFAVRVRLPTPAGAL